VALLKLYAESDSSDLVSTLMSCCSHLSDAGVTDCADWLNKYSRHHAVGLLYHFHGDDAAALDVWTRHDFMCLIIKHKFKLIELLFMTVVWWHYGKRFGLSWLIKHPTVCCQVMILGVCYLAVYLIMS